jgi:capsid protein
MIDPSKDTTALIAQVRAGFVPQPEAIGAFGYDFRQVIEMIREANALLDDAGLPPRQRSAPRRQVGRRAGRGPTRRHRNAATGAAAPPRPDAPPQP